MHLLLRLSIFALIVLTSNKCYSQQAFPAGTKIAIVSDLQRWVSICDNCQKLKNPKIRLTPVSVQDTTGHKPGNHEIYTVEYQDGKIRLMTYWNTYLSVCTDCRINDPNYLVIGHVQTDVRTTKIGKEGLFEFVPLEGSCGYAIKTYNGSYLTRYNVGNEDMHSGTQVIAGYYKKTDRASGIFKVIVTDPPKQTRIIPTAEKAVQLDIIQQDPNDELGYYLKEFHGAWKYWDDRNNQLSVNSFNDRFFGVKFEFLGANQGYKITIDNSNFTSEGKVLGLSPNTGPACSSNNETMQVHWIDPEKMTENSVGNLWNIELKCDGIIIQNRFTGLYLGADHGFVRMVNKEDATIIYPQKKTTWNEPLDNSEYETLKVPGTKYEIINPDNLPLLSFPETIRKYPNAEITFNNVVWSVATKEKAKEIITNIHSSNCELPFSSKILLLIKEDRWDPNSNFSFVIDKNSEVYHMSEDTRKRKTLFYREVD